MFAKNECVRSGARCVASGESCMSLWGRRYIRATSPTAIDYGLLAALIGLALMALATVLGHDVATLWLRSPSAQVTGAKA